MVLGPRFSVVGLGGISRDHNDIFIDGFMMCTSPTIIRDVEFLSIIVGLDKDWQMVIRCLVVERESQWVSSISLIAVMSIFFNK